MEQQTTSDRPGLAMLKRLQAQKQQQSTAPADKPPATSPATVKHDEAQGCKSSKTPPTIPTAGADMADEVARRVQILRPIIPPRGPIYPVRVRNTPQTDMPGMCSMCGDALAPGRRYRCAPCVAALEQVFNERREDVPMMPLENGDIQPAERERTS